MIKKIAKLPLHLIILIIFSVSIFSAGIGIPLATHMSIPNFINSLNSETITPQELKTLQLNDDNSVILIDVRSPQEYRQEHIEGSILIPLSDIEADFGVKQINKLAIENQNSTIVLYCSAGVRSLKAYHILKENGIKTVSLKGGINAWESI